MREQSCSLCRGLAKQGGCGVLKKEWFKENREEKSRCLEKTPSMWMYLGAKASGGPISEETLEKMISVGILTKQDKICRDCTEKWIAIKDTKFARIKGLPAEPVATRRPFACQRGIAGAGGSWSCICRAGPGLSFVGGRSFHKLAWRVLSIWDGNKIKQKRKAVGIGQRLF